MKKHWLLLATIAISITLSAQTAQSAKTLSKVLELVIPREGGANAASVAWHPVLKKYYAAMAGNTDFFIGMYDTKGKLLSPVSQKAMFDIRGLWYNPLTKTLQMNGYNDFGRGEYKLDTKGFPASVKILRQGMTQPDEQSVGAFNPKSQVLYFLNSDCSIEVYGLKDSVSQTTIELTLTMTKEEAKEDDGATDNYDLLDYYNSTSIVYTGIPGSEIGLLNYVNHEIELYNLKDGHLTRKLALPDDAPAPGFLNFSYCNGIYWLFDNEARIWKGYK